MGHHFNFRVMGPCVCRVSIKWSCQGEPVKWGARIASMEEVKENKKVLYHFAVFATVNELLIIKNCLISPSY